MKNLRIIISSRLDQLDERWRALPLKKQHRYTLLLFLGYALLSLFVIIKVCYDLGKHNTAMPIEHIVNPVINQKKPAGIPQDSISIILKNKMYER